MASGADLNRLGWNGDGTGTNGHVAKQVKEMSGIVQDQNGELHFAEWNCRAGQNNVIIRTNGTVGPMFPDVSLNLRLGQHRSAQIRRDPAGGYEEDLSTTLLLHP